MNAIDTTSFAASSAEQAVPFEPFYTIKEAALATGFPYWLLLQAVKDADIPHVCLGNTRRRVRLSDVEEALKWRRE